MRIHILWFFTLVGTVALAGRADARLRRPEDLKRQIESEQAAVGDLERLDERRVAVDELALLKSWFDEAWGQYGKEEFDRVREILEISKPGPVRTPVPNSVPIAYKPGNITGVATSAATSSGVVNEIYTALDGLARVSNDLRDRITSFTF